jgi:hypothetical protein
VPGFVAHRLTLREARMLHNAPAQLRASEIIASAASNRTSPVGCSDTLDGTR